MLCLNIILQCYSEIIDDTYTIILYRNEVPLDPGVVNRYDNNILRPRMNPTYSHTARIMRVRRCQVYTAGLVNYITVTTIIKVQSLEHAEMQCAVKYILYIYAYHVMLLLLPFTTKFSNFKHHACAHHHRVTN